MRASPFGRHNMGQKAAQNLHPQVGSSKGVLGRVLDELAAGAASYKGGAYSIDGNSKAVDGETYAPDIMSPSNGAVRFLNSELSPEIKRLLAPTSESIFGETVAGLFEAALERSVLLGDALSTVELTETFGDVR